MAVVTTGINLELLSLLTVFFRFSRADWLALGRLAGLGLILALASGCVATVRPARPVAVVAAPPSAVVVRETPRADVVVAIREAPPPPRREVIVERERPSREHVWIAGYWRHDGRAYAWVPGHWERPPHARMTWIAPRWEFRNGGYVFVEGVWH